MKNCSSLVVIREMEIKTIMRYHLTLIRMVIIKNYELMLERVWRNGNSPTVGGYVNWCTHYGKQYRGYLKNRVAKWFSCSTPGHLSREKHDPKRYMHSSVHCGTIYNSQDMEEPEMSIDRWMDKEGLVHIYNGILLSH